MAVALVGLAVGAVVGGLTAYGQYKEAKSQQEAVNANAKIELRNAYERERAARRSGMLEVSRQQARAQSGGLLLEGSPLEQLARNVNAVEYQAVSERNVGINASNYMRWQARTAVKQARSNIWKGALMGGLQGLASGYASGGGLATTTTGTSLLATKAPAAGRSGFSPTFQAARTSP